mmetsp:Transcript_98012/g.136151  ORF Transcript_98012/g.136151 Transcript_98012/m.136151 type:complete len:212 (-) Transcript_98012:268-903(-)
MHSVNILIFIQLHIILVHGNTKDNSSYILKTMCPLLSLTTLSTHIYHTKMQFVYIKLSLVNSRSTCTATQYIISTGNISRYSNTINVVHGVFSRVRKLEYTSLLIYCLNGRIFPKLFKLYSHLWCQSRLHTADCLVLFSKSRILSFNSHSKFITSIDKNLNSLDGVALKDWFVTKKFCLCKAIQVNDLHLFRYSRLSRLPGTKQQKLHFFL